MELSLQKRISASQVAPERANLIKKFKLHIDDKIDYDNFLKLYKKYKDEYSEEEFAKYFLDVPRIKLYYLKSGKTKETPILTREFISGPYLNNIRKKVITEIRTRNLGKKLYYSEISELHQKFGKKLSLKMFAEEILDVTPHSMENLKSDYTKPATILKGDKINPLVIEKSLSLVVRDAGLHIGDQITLEQFRDIHKKFGTGLTEREFAVKVLGISGSQINVLLAGKNKTVGVFAKYIYDPEEIAKLREKVIKEENLHIGDLVDNKRFLELHQKYGGILSEEIFADEILDINEIGVKNMRVSGTNSAVLGDVEVSKEYLEWLSKKIVSVEKLASKYEITKDEFLRMYESYAGVLSQKQFALDVLKISKDSLSAFFIGTYKKTNIFLKEEITDFEALRRKVISEKHLHIDDSIDYYQFDEIRKQFAPNMPEVIFAQKVLDLSTGAFYGMKFGKGRYHTFILMNEKLPTKQELIELKEKILYKNNLHIRDSITYEQLQKMFYEDGGTMPMSMFAEKIFDISHSKLRDMRLHPDKEDAVILLNTKVLLQDVMKLRYEILTKFNIQKEQPITWQDFTKYFNSEKHIMSEMMFANAVLGINEQSINKLRNGKSATIRARKTEFNLEALDWVSVPKQREPEKPKKIFKKVRKQVDFSGEIKYPESDSKMPVQKFTRRSGQIITKEQAKSVIKNLIIQIKALKK